MAVTADRIIVEIEASTGKARADLAVYERLFGKSMSTIERSAVGAEKQFRASAAGISSGIKSLAATFATAFSARQVAALADSYTRFTNQLKVAGLEGQNLTEQQAKLFDIAQRNGVEMEALGTLYSRAARNSKDLGASQAELAQFTSAVAASLRINNTSVTEASGALLQLGQALGSPRVQMEEFGSLIDGMTPLLQAASKYIDGTGGSLAGLTQKLKDTKGPGVSNIELFRAIVRAQAELDEQAAKTTLTIGASFQTLNNALGKYVGETDQALSATQRISQGIKALADNLNTIIPALAAIATIMGVRLVASIGASTIAMIAKVAADVRAAQTATALAAAQARLNPLLLGTAAAAAEASAAVTGLSVAQGVATRGFGVLSALVGGSVGASLLALGAGFYYLSTRMDTAAEAATKFQDAINRGNATKDRATDLARKLASATGEERRQTELAIAATLKKAKADQVAALAAVKRAQAELALAQAAAARVERSEAANTTGRGSAELGTVRAEAQRNLRLRTGELQGATEALKILNEAVSVLKDPLSVPALPDIGTVGEPGSDQKRNNRSRSGPSLEDIAKRFDDERANLAQQALSSQQSMARSAEEKAELELRSVELARIRTLADINANGDYREAQKKILREQVERLAEVERDRVNFEKTRQLEDEARNLADDKFRAEQDQLRMQYDLADSQAERRRIALAIIDAEYAYQKSLLEAVKNSETASAAEKERAQIALNALDAMRSGRQELARRDTEGPLARYRRDLGTLDRTNDMVENAVIDELQSVRDSISSAVQKTLGVKNPILAALINAFIEQQLIRPFMDAMETRGGGGFLGGIGAVLGSVFGGFRASGGPVTAGRAYMVGERGQEMFVPQQSGVIVPNHALSARTSESAPTIIQVDARGAVMNDQFARLILSQAQQYAAQAGQAAYAGAVRDTPVVMAKRQRYG